MNSHIISSESSLILNSVLTKVFEEFRVLVHQKLHETWKHQNITQKFPPQDKDMGDVKVWKTGLWLMLYSGKLKQQLLFRGNVSVWVLQAPHKVFREQLMPTCNPVFTDWSSSCGATEGAGCTACLLRAPDDVPWQIEAASSSSPPICRFMFEDFMRIKVMGKRSAELWRSTLQLHLFVQAKK